MNDIDYLLARLRAVETALEMTMDVVLERAPGLGDELTAVQMLWKERVNELNEDRGQ